MRQVVKNSMDTNEEEFLCELYKETGGQITPVDMYPTGDKCALGKNVTENIVKRLIEKGLVEAAIGFKESHKIWITKKGRDKAKELCGEE